MLFIRAADAADVANQRPFSRRFLSRGRARSGIKAAVEIDQLRTLLAVLEHGSFTRAALAIHASQSTVSFHVRALEDAVGARLLDRRRRGVRPTPAGRVVASYARRIVTLRAEALARL